MAGVPADTEVIFVDEAGNEYVAKTVRAGHTKREARAVAYRWLCMCIAQGKISPVGELHYRGQGPIK